MTHGMNVRSSSWTGRSPRCMSSAFGPYTDNVLHPLPEKNRMTAADKALLVLAAITLGICAAIWTGVL